VKQFNQLGIKPVLPSFTGDKIKITRILNKEITVYEYKIDNSKFDKGNGKCLVLQIAVGDTRHIVFTGSTVLMETIQQVSKSDFPFKTTIVKDNERFEFS
jgi:hypothetical protein